MMIYADDGEMSSKLEAAWRTGKECHDHPSDALDTLFSGYRLVDRDVQFSDSPIPEGQWFIDWGLPRRRYGGFQVVAGEGLGRVRASKLASALCPECHNPIFTVLLPNGHGGGRHKAQQLCLSCGHWEFLSLPR